MIAPGGSPKVESNNNLINGRMHLDCSTVASGGKNLCFDNAEISKLMSQTGRGTGYA